MKSSDDMYGLVVDGGTLTLIMPYEENKDLLYQVSFSILSDAYFLIYEILIFYS